MGTAGAALLVAAVTVYFASAPGATGRQAAQALSTPVVPSVTASVTASVTPSVAASPSPTPSEQDTPTADAAKLSQSAKAVSTAHADPQPTRTRTPQATKTSVRPSSPAPTRTPARKATTTPAKTTAPPANEDPPAPSQGTITLADAREYCKAIGQSGGAGTWDNLWCFGGTRITATQVCQWKYQGRDAVAEQPANSMATELTCRLS